MNEDALVRDTVATIVIALIDVCRNAHDVDRITHQLLGEFDVLLETEERAARAMLMFAILCADARAYSAEWLMPSRLGSRTQRAFAHQRTPHNQEGES